MREYWIHQIFFFNEMNGERLRQEVFYLAYHLHWSWSDVMALDLGDRKNYVQMLVERINVENKMLEDMENKFSNH